MLSRLGISFDFSKASLLRAFRFAFLWVALPFACAILFAYWTFPYDRLRDYVVQQIETRDVGGRREATGYQAEIVDLSPYWFSGVELTGFRIAKVEGSETRDVTFESLIARLQILPLLLGERSLKFEGMVAGGSVNGQVGQSSTSLAIDTELAAVDLRRASILRNYVPLPLRGVADGHVTLELNEDESTNSGQIDLRFAGLRVGDGRAALPIPGMSEGLIIDQIDAGNLTLGGRLVGSELELTTLRSRGPDLELDGAGGFTLRLPLSRSTMNLLLRARLTDAYKNKSDRTRSMFTLLDFSPATSQAKTPDGALQFRLSGAVSRPTSRPAGRDPMPGAGE